MIGLKKLIKETEIRRIDRISDMVEIGLGNEIEYTSVLGKKKIKNKQTFHIQCPFRIKKDKKLIVGNRDIYNVCDENKNWDDWEKYGSNYFDKIVENEIKPDLPLEILDIAENDDGDVSIFLSKGYCIEIFVNAASEDEYWRFMDTYTDKHYVFNEK